MQNKTIPTLYEWAGGQLAVERLIERFYQKVRQDPILEPLFQNASAGHSHRVALFLAEVLGGPNTYSAEQGGHARMIARHIGRHLTQQQRKQWVSLLLEAADEVGLPDDPEFRSAFVGYLEWGSRLAVINSQPGAQLDPNAPMPQWGWGEAGKPYQG